MSINPAAGPGPAAADPPYPAASPAAARPRPGPASAACARTAAPTRPSPPPRAWPRPPSATWPRGRRRSTRGTAPPSSPCPATPSRGPAWTPAAPGCGCAPCTSWATAPPASPAPSASARQPSSTSSAATPAPSARKLRDAITDLYDAWWDKRAPERTRAERAAAAAARRRAIAGDWCAAAALDDDQLDIPGYRPRQGWKPATGTGIAPDIRPPARHHRKDPPMTSDYRNTPGLIHDILDALERHGYHRSDDQHADRAIGAHRRPGPHLRRHPGLPRRCLPRHGAIIPARLSRTQRPGRRHPRRRRRQHRPGRAGHSRRPQTRPRRDLRRLRGPVLPHMPGPAPGRPSLRPPCRPAGPGRRAAPRRQSQPARARPPAPSPPPTGKPASDALPPHTGRTRQPPARRALHSQSASGRQGHAGDSRTLRPAVPRPLAARPPRLRHRGRPAPRLAARPVPIPRRAPGNRPPTREPEPDLEAEP